MGLSDILDRAAASWFGLDQKKPEARSGSWTFQDYVTFLTSGSSRFPLTTYGSTTVTGPADFAGYVSNAYAANGIVFAAAVARAAIFSEARFKYRTFGDSGTGRLFGGPSLAPLEKFPGNQTTPDFLARMLGHADFAGQAWPVMTETGLVCLRPDWVTPVVGSRFEPVDNEAAIPDAELIGLVYHPGGQGRAKRGIVYLPGEFAHWAPIKDPMSSWAGMSWLTPIIREVMADIATTTHKLKFFENGATPNAVVTFDPTVDVATYDAWVDRFEQKNKGAANAYKTVYLGGGTTLTPVGKDFQQIDLKAVQGAGETRIAVAAGIPAVVLGISEGLAGSSLNAGNYTAARRRLADMTMRPLWRSVCGALSVFVPAPAGSELWYDDRDIPFLQEDMKDAADIASTQAMAVRNLVDAGFQPDAAVLAVYTGNFAALSGQHSGLYSVQLQAPGTVASSPTPDDPARSLALAVLARGDQREQVVIHNHQPPVTFEAGDDHVTPGAITVENRVEPSPVAVENHTTVAPTPVTVENHTTIEPTPVTVENRVDVAPASVTVTTPDTLHIASMPARETRRKVTKRTEKGGIAEAIDIEQDAEA
jgi:hypothetical protein